jgi:mannose-6-phosphate isomerase-like protein (cupin superfamily)
VGVAQFSRGEGSHVEARGSDMWFKATAASTAGRFSLMERTLPPGGRMPPAHHHVGNDEAYYVLEGDVEFRVGPDVVRGGPDTCILVPAGETHTFGNTSDAPARLLVLHAPALDGYFVELARLWSKGAPPDRDLELELMRRYGMVPD